ncbi:hypothetical protein AAMO2058_000998600 [Amorphochlora amoebiformis]
MLGRFGPLLVSPASLSLWVLVYGNTTVRLRGMSRASKEAGRAKETISGSITGLNVEEVPPLSQSHRFDRGRFRSMPVVWIASSSYLWASATLIFVCASFWRSHEDTSDNKPGYFPAFHPRVGKHP